MYSAQQQGSSGQGNRWQHCWRLFALCFVLVLPSLDVRAETFDGEELKDPTRPADAPLVVAEEGEPGFLSGLFGSAASLLKSDYKVTFIRAGGTEPIAMVNEQLVKTGDMIGAAQVVSIDAQSVSLRVNGTIQRVATYSDTVKTQAEPR